MFFNRKQDPLFRMLARKRHIWVCFSLLFVVGVNPADACGGEITSFAGTITSPGHPSNYPPNAICTWDINVPFGYRILLKFTSFDLEAFCDYVKVSSMMSGNIVQTHGAFNNDNSRRPPSSLQSVGNSLRITFTSDGSNQYSGFAAVYSAFEDPNLRRPLFNSIVDVTIIFPVKENDEPDPWDKDERYPVEFYARTNALGVMFDWPELGNIDPCLLLGDPLACNQTRCDWEKVNMIQANSHDQLPLQFSSTSSKMTSSLFVPKSSRVCFIISINAFTSAGLTADIINTQGSVVNLGRYTSKVTDWQQLWRLEVPLGNNYQDGAKVRLMKTNDIYIEINYIHSCDLEETECAFGLSKENVPDIKEKIRRFNPTALVLSEGTNSKLHCMNGGVATQHGCACPAGFNGAQCQQGCGANKFGQDCGGQCSTSGTECEGLILCTPGVGCGCAPGYFGPECDQKCDSKAGLNNFYGSNCTESCGNCEQEVPQCDIYTGECHRGCVKGYEPPICRNKLVHTKIPPVLTASEYGVIVAAVDLSESNLAGGGKAKYYQIQYKKNGERVWNIHETTEISEKLKDSVNINDLETGKVYNVRTVLILEDYGKYDHEDVPSSKIRTKCYVPPNYNYNISVNNIKSNSLQSRWQPRNTLTLTFEWVLNTEKTWCPVSDVEIHYKRGLKWNSFNTTWKTNFTMSNVLPNKNLWLKVRAITGEDVVYPYSDVFAAQTPTADTFKVENITVENIESNTCTLKWSVSPAPKNLEHVNYKITYQCIERAACNELCGESREEVSTTETSIVLRGLLPSSRYYISVTANDREPVVTYLGTLSSEPTEVPLERPHSGDLKHTNEAIVKSNTSATVYWDKGEVCSGYFENYVYELYEAATLAKSLEVGKTKLSEKTFLDLKPNTDYVVRVFIQTNAGKNSKAFLSINTSTDATVPEQVRNLTVYKQGQHMLGVRWARPRLVYGELDGFTISYWQKNLPASKKSARIEPTLCTSWPDLYCHTVQALRPGQTYNVAVSALNKNKQDPGESSFVSGLTREKSPGPPENLKMVNVTSTTVTVQWDPPFLQNGVLRTFLVSVEETETHNEEACCQTFPVMEKAVTAEVLHHQLEISGLNPASTYSISITGRTNGFGPAQTLSVTTAPPPLLVTLPQQLVLECGDMVWMSQENTSHASDSVYQSLVVYRCILILQNSTANSVANIESGIKDERLKELLDDRLEPVYYLAAEYEEADAVNIPGEEGRFDSKWGRSQARTLGNTTLYQLAAVQVTEYNGVLNADILLSTHFTSC